MFLGAKRLKQGIKTRVNVEDRYNQKPGSFLRKSKQDIRS